MGSLLLLFLFSLSPPQSCHYGIGLGFRRRPSIANADALLPFAAATAIVMVMAMIMAIEDSSTRSVRSVGFDLLHDCSNFTTFTIFCLHFLLHLIYERAKLYKGLLNLSIAVYQNCSLIPIWSWVYISVIYILVQVLTQGAKGEREPPPLRASPPDCQRTNRWCVLCFKRSCMSVSLF